MPKFELDIEDPNAAQVLATFQLLKDVLNRVSTLPAANQVEFYRYAKQNITDRLSAAQQAAALPVVALPGGR